MVRTVDKDSHAVSGKLQAYKNRLVDFDARKWHGVESWQGDRWTITAFQTRSAADLTPLQEQHLQDYGFSPGLQGPTVPRHDHFAEWISTAVWRDSTGAAPTGTTEQFFEDLDLVVDDEEVEGDQDAGHAAEAASSSSPPRPPEPPVTEDRVTESQKALVKKLHENTGHPVLERSLRTLRAAGALPHVLKYVKDEFRCDTCATKRGPDHRRKAQCPRVFSFNRVLSMDVFYVDFKGVKEAILNMVDHGTNYQIAQRIPGTGRTPTSYETWRTFLMSWARFLGPPSLIITDGGREFLGRFERGLEQLGVLHHITAPESPWQNSWAERHGGWLKQKLSQELDSGQGIATNLDELDELLTSLVSAKNRWFNAGGYTPTRWSSVNFLEYQVSCWQTTPLDSRCSVTPTTTPLVLMKQASSFVDATRFESVPSSWPWPRPARRRYIEQFGPPALPCVRGLPDNGFTAFEGASLDLLHPVSRWVGPGVVVLQSPSVVWVAMRTRLWRCSPEQLRPAFPS